MNLEQFQIELPEHVVLVDLAGASDAADRMNAIEQSLVSNKAFPLTQCSFGFSSTDGSLASVLRPLVEPHIRDGDRVLLISRTESGLDGIVLLLPPKGEGISVVG